MRNRRRKIDSALDALSPKERAVMRARFGLDDGVERTPAEAARSLSLTRERVRQIEAAALRKLRGSKALSTTYRTS